MAAARMAALGKDAVPWARREQVRSGEEQREAGWFGDVCRLALALRGEVGVVNRDGLGAGRRADGAEPDETHFERIGDAEDVGASRLVSVGGWKHAAP